MKKITLVLLLSVWALLSTVCHAGKHREFKTGKLLDMSVDEILDEGSTERYGVYQVQLGDTVYVGRGSRMSSGGKTDPSHGLIIGDPVQAAIEGDQLYLIRPDGKEIKARITKRKRAELKP